MLLEGDSKMSDDLVEFLAGELQIELEQVRCSGLLSFVFFFVGCLFYVFVVWPDSFGFVTWRRRSSVHMMRLNLLHGGMRTACVSCMIASAR